MPLRRSLALILVAALAGPAFAAPVDELLRVAPPDAAFVLVVKDARTHVANLQKSPFAASFRASPLGRQVLESGDLKKLREAIDHICTQTQTPPRAFLDEVLGDAVVFALYPEAGGQERSILLLRPSNPALLDQFVEKLNTLQKASGELESVKSSSHGGGTITERKKTAGGSEFYASRNGSFAFSSSESEIKAFLDRDSAREKRPAFNESISRLGLDSAAAVLLVNPRALDSELDAKIAGGKPSEQAFLQWFTGYWKKLDAAALYLKLDADAEIGLALRPREGESLFAPVAASHLWSSIPDDALLAVAGRQKLSDLLDSLGQLIPEDGLRALRAVVEQSLAPIIGKDKLPVVVDALGPNWALWIEPPSTGFLPATVFAIEVQTAGAKGDEAQRALGGAMQYLFQTAQVIHNTRRADQIELVVEEDGGATIRSLRGDKSFPAGVQPAFAIKDGYLLLASDPSAIRRFRKPAAPKESVDVPLARFSASALRKYLQAHGPALAEYASAHSGKPASEVRSWLTAVAEMFEPIDRVDVVSRSSGSGVHLALRLTTSKPLKP